MGQALIVMATSGERGFAVAGVDPEHSLPRPTAPPRP
jgi:hypothetical protein